MGIMDDLSLSPTERGDADLGSPLLPPNSEIEADLGTEGVDKQRKGLEDIFNLL